MNLKITLVILLLTISKFIIAQPAIPSLKIEGNVVDADLNTPMEYVNVALYNMRDSSLVTGTISNENGIYEITPPRPGRFYLQVDFMGYQMQKIHDVKVTPTEPIYRVNEVKLQRSNIAVEAVEVTAEKPFVTYEIDRKVIDVSKNPSAQGGTAVDALENVPSVEVDVEGNVALRGNTNFTVLVDGRQSILSGTDALNQIPSSAIESIEIITNPSAKYDPDGTAGIINVVTKKGKYQGHSLLINTSVRDNPTYFDDISYSTDLTYSMRKKHFTLNTSASIGTFGMPFSNSTDRVTKVFDEDTIYIGDKYIDNLRNGSFKRSNTRLSVGIDYYVTPANTFSFSVGYNDFEFVRNFSSDIHTTTTDKTEHFERTETAFDANPNSYQVNLGDRHVFNENNNHFLAVDFMYQNSIQTNSDYINADTINSSGIILTEFDTPAQSTSTTEDNSSVRLEINYSQPFSDMFWLEAGYTLRSDAYTQEYSRLFSEIVNPEYNDKANFERTIHAAWVSVKGEVMGLQYAAGLRFESTNRYINTIKDNWDFSYEYPGLYPSISLAKEWGEGQIIQSSYTKRINRPRGHHMNPFPSLSDGYTRFEPNPELEPEYAHSAELNYQKMWGSNFIAIESFYRYTMNEMDRISEPHGDTIVRTMINLGSESDAGLEMVFNYKPFKWWLINPTVTVSQHKVEGTYLNENRTEENIDYRASFTTNFFLSTNSRIQLMGRYRGPRNEIDGKREADYYVSGAIRQEFMDRKLGLTLRVDDIFGTRKRESWTYTNTTTIHSIGQRKSPMIMISLQYRFNQQDSDRRGNREQSNDADGGDMDMGF